VEPSYDSAADVVDAVNAAGVPCVNPQLVARGGVEEKVSCDPYDTGQGEDQVSVTTFADDDQQEAQAKLAELWAGTAFAEGGFTVVGDGWMVQLRSQNNAEHLANELGGEVA